MLALFKAERGAKNGFTVIVTSQVLLHFLPKQKHCLVYTIYLFVDKIPSWKLPCSHWIIRIVRNLRHIWSVSMSSTQTFQNSLFINTQLHQNSFLTENNQTGCQKKILHFLNSYTCSLSTTIIRCWSQYHILGLKKRGKQHHIKCNSFVYFPTADRTQEQENTDV
jgi:hypothetical protein